jgi:hypothetical protein
MENASPNYLMTQEPQSTLQATKIECPALRNHLPCMAYVVALPGSACMSCLGVKDQAKFWEAHKCDQEFRENESIDIGKSQSLRNMGNSRPNNMFTMRRGLAKIIEKVRIS